jgi:hypothetical protein
MWVRDYYVATLELARDKVLKVSEEELDEAWCYLNGLNDDDWYRGKYEEQEEDCK